jgi:geranylgeranyl diphosphate synthase type II
MMGTLHDSDLETRLEEIRAAVDRRLDELVPTEETPPALLHRVMRYSLLAPGKRVRPALTLLTAESLGASPDLALDPACALEMVHAASLILDDLPFMDDALHRRGRPACHVAFGEDIAILASISLLNRAYAVLTDAPGLEKALRLELVAMLASRIGDEGIVSGQVHDLRLAEEDDPGQSEVERMAGQKTGALFVAAAEMGARIAGYSGKPLESVRAFAWDLGLCFQALDDLSDRNGTLAELGKDVGQDVSKATFVSVMGPSRARRASERFAAAAVRALGPIRPAAEPLVSLTGYLMRRSRQRAAAPR